MKNYLATGLIFLAVGIIRLQQNWLSDRVGWPLILLLAGSIMMLAGARYSSWRAALGRLFRKQGHQGQKGQKGHKRRKSSGSLVSLVSLFL